MSKEAERCNNATTGRDDPEFAPRRKKRSLSQRLSRLSLLCARSPHNTATTSRTDRRTGGLAGKFFLCRASRQPLCVLYCFCRRRAARKERDEARSAKPRLERAHGAGTRSFTLPIGKSPFVAGFPPFPHYSPFFFLAPAAARSPLFSTACSSSWLAFVLWRSPSVIYSSRKTRLFETSS